MARRVMAGHPPHLLLLAAGCSPLDRTTGDRALTGTAVGAAAGAAVGLLSGGLLSSTVTGAVAGAAGGLVVRSDPEEPLGANSRSARHFLSAAVCSRGHEGERRCAHWLLLLAAGLIGGLVRLQAEEPKLDTTGDLVAYCDTVGPVGEVRDGQNFCDGFIAGSGLLYLELVEAKKIKKLACADPIPTLSEARDAFVAWAKANPEHLSDDRSTASGGRWPPPIPAQMSRADRERFTMRKTSLVLAGGRPDPG